MWLNPARDVHFHHLNPANFAASFSVPVNLWNLGPSIQSTGSTRFATVCLATIHNNDGFKNRRPKILNKLQNFQKCPTVNTGCDVQKQHSQSEMTAIPIYHLSQSGMRLIILLKQEPPCPVREVQWRQVNVTVSPKVLKKVENPQSGTLSDKSNLNNTRRSIKYKRSCITAALQKFSVWASKIIIIINIKDWTPWSVPSLELQLLAPTLLRSSNCSPSLWSVVVWFQRD